MAITVKHKFVSAIPDDTDATVVRPSNWNDDHDLTGTIPVANGGTGASTLTGYVYGNGTSAMTASTTVPSTDITGLGTMSTQNANAVAVTGGTVNGATIGATTASTGAFTYISTSSSTSTTPTLSFNGSNAPYAAGATISGSYLQHLLQNKSGTTGASTNYVLSNDLGTDSTYYGEFGMNSSVFSSGTPSDFFSLNNGIYFSGHDGDVTIGSGNGYKTYLAWGTTGQSAHVINATGSIGLNTNITGTTNYGTAGQVLTSGGSAATPTWTTVSSGSGTVTSVALTAPSIFTVTGSPITSSGTLALTYSGTALPIANGGTNATATPTAGAVPYGTGTAYAFTAAGTSGQVLQSNGSSAPSWVTAPASAAGGSNTQIQFNNSGVLAGNSTYTMVSGVMKENGFNFVSQADVGYNPNQISLNQYLGKLAFQDVAERNSASSLASSAGLTAVTAVTGSLTLATGGVTLANQTMAVGSVWRIRAYGTYAGILSANVRQLTMRCFWGSTALTAVTSGNLLTTAQTSPWSVEFVITGSSATAVWVTGLLSSQVTSATIPLDNIATAASVTGLTTNSTLDFRVGQTGTATADTINVHSVTMERIK